jgi:hypothetical protein
MNQKSKQISTLSDIDQEISKVITDICTTFGVKSDDVEFRKIAAGHALQAKLLDMYETKRMITMLQVFKSLAPQLGIPTHGTVAPGTLPMQPTITVPSGGIATGACADDDSIELPDIIEDPKLVAAYNNPMDWMFTVEMSEA